MKSSETTAALIMALAADGLDAPQQVIEDIERDDPEWVHKLRLQQAKEKRERKALHMRGVAK